MADEPATTSGEDVNKALKVVRNFVTGLMLIYKVAQQNGLDMSGVLPPWVVKTFSDPAVLATLSLWLAWAVGEARHIQLQRAKAVDVAALERRARSWQ